MTPAVYLSPLRRWWWLAVVIILLDLVVSVLLYARSARHAGYVGCTTLYVADVSSPSLISAPSTTLETAGQLLAGETAANFFGDDILDVAESQHVAAYVARELAPRHLPSVSEANINGSVSGSRRDRTVQLCVSNPAAASAEAAAGMVGRAMTTARAQFIGRQMAKRTYVTVISDPSTAKVSTRPLLTSLLLRVVLGILVALGAAYLADFLVSGSGPPRQGTARLVS